VSEAHSVDHSPPAQALGLAGVPAMATQDPHAIAHGHAKHAHQFDDAEQQRQAATLGMWAFLCTEVLFFGALFFAYTVYRFRYPEAFRIGSQTLAFWLGTVNTAVLLCSSLAMALAVHAAATGHKKNIGRFLLLTMALGATFLCVKAFEYHTEWEEGLVPHFNFTHVFHQPGSEAPLKLGNEQNVLAPAVDMPGAPITSAQGIGHIELFFCFYFIMTALHALHMVIGIAIMGILVIRARRGAFTPENHTAVEITGLYWHFVDIVWVFLYPLLYLLIQR
jgi:cytochrome c oxidase subunit 3